MTLLFDTPDQSIVVIVVDETGAPVPGLDHTDFATLAYRKGVNGAMVDITPASLAAITTGHTDGGIKELHATKAPGAYRVDLPDAAATSGAGDVITVHATVADARPVHQRYELVSPLTSTVAGSVDANVTHAAGTAWTSGAITSAVFAAGAITAAAIATDAIGAAELSNAGAEKIANEVLATITSDNTAFAGADIAAIKGFLDTEIAAILADTNELQTDWANGGRLDLLIDAVKAKTDNLPAAPAATGDIPTAVQNADALLGRNSAGGGSGTRTVAMALARLVNRVRNNAGTMEVYAANDTDILWTAALTTAAGNPIREVNP